MKNFFYLLISLTICLLLNQKKVKGQCVADTSNIYSFNYNGGNYEIIKENKSWTAAAACAIQRGGFLAEINSQTEQDSIFSRLGNASITNSNTTAPDGGGGAYVWLGGSDIANEGTWLWDGNNDSLGNQFWSGGKASSGGMAVGSRYTNWGNEPDNYLGVQNSLGLSLNGWPLGTSGQWNDLSSSNSLYYVVEHPPCNNTNSSITDTACNSYTSPSGKIWNTSNTYQDTIRNAKGCDSIITVNLEVITIDTSLTVSKDSITANQSNANYQWLNCSNNNFTIINGETSQNFSPNSNGKYAVSININKCTDTSRCVEITCNNTNSSITDTACNSYTSPSGKIWNASNTYKDTIRNAKGCDSIITINLEIITIDTSLTLSKTTITANQSNANYQWLNCSNNNYTIINGETSQNFSPNSNGKYAVRININKCTDTSRCVEITCNNTNSSITDTACNSYTSPSGKIWNASNTYKDTIRNAKGCDSIITVNLEVITIDTSLTLSKTTITANQSNANYQWLNCSNNNYTIISGETSQNFSPNSNGKYAVSININKCTDTSRCVETNGVSIVSKNTISEQVFVYPNPNKGEQVNINFKNLSNVSIKVYNLYGQIVLKKENITTSEYHFNLNVSSGIYIIKVTTEEGDEGFLRIVKE